MGDKQGVPEDARTIASSRISSRASDGQELLEKLEVHYLANQGENLIRAASATSRTPTRRDARGRGAADQALAGVEELNARYDPDSSALQRFHLSKQATVERARGK